ncbi:unnamed protein product [Rotaria socialis]
MIYNTTIIDVINKRILTNKNIGIVGGKISSINDSFSINYPLDIANERIDGSYLIALPGFVNTHTHLWQHISKSSAPKEPLQTWVKVYRPIHYLTKDELSDVVFSASCEALLSGITTVSDYASLSFNDYGFETNADSISKAGLNGVLVWNNPSIFLHDQIKLREIERLKIKYKNKFDIWMGFGPLSFHSIPAVYSGILIAEQLNLSTTEHTMENIQEQRDFYNSTVSYLKQYNHLNLTDEEFLYNLTNLTSPSNVDAYEQLLRNAQHILKYDTILQNDPTYKKLTNTEKHILSSLEYNRRISPLILLDYLKILQNHVAIHGVWLQNEDIDIIKRNTMSISHNPESNMYLASGIAPIDSYLRANVLITIGTDGGASNDGVNFFSAMRAMRNGHKINLMNTAVSKTFDEWNIIQAATINGAKAFKMDDKIGSIDIGKQADISLIATNEFGMSPLRLNNTISLLIYSANTRNIKYVISNGTIRVENSSLKWQDQSKLAENLSKIAKDVDVRMIAGKNWSEIYTITTEDLTHSYWYKYQSIRANDTVNLTIQSVENITICIVVSGAVFGGGTATVADHAVHERFPDIKPPQAFSKSAFLSPGIPLHVTKIAQQYRYTIYLGNSIIFEKNSPVAGQLLILALHRNSQLSTICLDSTD